MISGAIDIVRLDDPPRVTLLDFKSGASDSDVASKLAKEDMRLQVSLYALAARKELEYEPERGLVRYLGEDDPSKRELVVDLSEEALRKARRIVVATAAEIRDRRFHDGPRRKPRNPKLHGRCGECDFVRFCGLEPAKAYRASLAPHPR